MASAIEDAEMLVASAVAEVEELEQRATSLRAEAREADDDAEDALDRLAAARANGASEDELEDLRAEHRERRAEADEADAAAEKVEQELSAAREKLEAAEQDAAREAQERDCTELTKITDELGANTDRLAETVREWVRVYRKVDQRATSDMPPDLRPIRVSVGIRRLAAHVLYAIIPSKWWKVLPADVRAQSAGQNLLARIGVKPDPDEEN